MVSMDSIKNVKKKLFDFLDLENSEKIAIISDNDEDGLTAALQAKYFFEKNGKKAEVFFYDHVTKDAGIFKREFTAFLPNLTIFLDLNENFVFDILNELNLEIKKFVVLDHHQGVEIIDDKHDFLVVKPPLFSNIEPSKYPASKMVYDLLGGKDWQAAIGIIGDSSNTTWENFLLDVEKNNSLEKNSIFELADIVGSVISNRKDLFKELFDLMYSIDNPKKLFDSKFFEVKKEFDKIIEKELISFKENKEEFKDLDLILFETRKGLSSKMSNILSQKHLHKLLFVYTKEKYFIKASLRRQDFKIDCNKLAQFCVSGLKGAAGGGHIPAAGLKFPKEDFQKFKGRLFEYLEKNYSKEN
jgi:single-stranded DNA-specific DHH superfamily exonuclease